MKIIIALGIISLAFCSTTMGEGRIPQMPTNVFKESLKDLEGLNKKDPTNCHPIVSKEKLDSAFIDNVDSFTTDLTCSFACAGDLKSQESQVSYQFNPVALSLKRGNGDLWAPLSSTLKYWSEDICLNEAKLKCGDLEKITSFRVLDLRSGAWKAQGLKFSCDDKQEYLPSPLSPEIKPTLSLLPSKDWIPKETFSKWEEPIKKNKKTNTLAPCQNPVEGTFCYGDCVYLEGKGKNEYLASPVPLGEDKISVCMDEIVSKIKGKKLSPNLIQHFCESNFFRTMKEEERTGITCSSSRININCSSLNIHSSAQ